MSPLIAVSFSTLALNLSFFGGIRPVLAHRQISFGGLGRRDFCSVFGIVLVMCDNHEILSPFHPQAPEYSYPFL